MKTRFLLVTDSRKHPWLPVIEEALSPLGDLDTQGERRAFSLIQQRRYKVIIIDATHTKDANQLLTRIRRKFQDVKVVFAAASPDWREARQAFRLGAIDYIYRSMTVNDLRSRFQPFVKRASQVPSKLK